MSDPLETAIRALQGQEPPGGFAPAAAVRRRGTRRTYRQLVAAAVAVLAVAGGTVAWAAGRADRRGPDVIESPTPTVSGTPSPSATPSPTPSGSPSPAPPVALTPAMFLTAADLGPGRWTIGQSSDYRADSWPWKELCQPYRPADYPSLAKRVQADWRDFSRTGGSGAGLQTIERYAPGIGSRNLDDVRARLRGCAGLQTPDPRIGNLPLRWSLVADGFAGDDAVLAKAEAFPDSGPTLVRYVVAVRVGDLVSNVWLDNGSTEAGARDLAAKAAARLRQAR
jgi:hypothetical protein